MIQKPAPTGPLAPVRGVPINKQKLFRPGTRTAKYPHGGGGPENVGATNDQDANIAIQRQNPPWNFEFLSDFFGPAAASTKPDVAGGGGYHNNNDLPANAFRQLGDIHGGRQ